MNNKQQIEELKKVNREQAAKIKQLELQIDKEEDLSPGDICECVSNWHEVVVKYYCGDINNEKRFSANKKNINFPENGITVVSPKKLNICNHKIIGEYWMATDKDSETWCHRLKPNRYESEFHNNFDKTISLGKNTNNQTFDDEPVKVYLVIEE